jgi:hypothetical protein
VPGRGVCPGPGNSRRVTFMVGFWEKIQSKDRGVDCPGPGQPFPGRHTAGDGEHVPSSNYTWPAEMEPIEIPVEKDLTDTRGGGVEWIDPILLPNIWEPVDQEGLSSSGPSGAEAAPRSYSAHYDTCFQGF